MHTQTIQLRCKPHEQFTLRFKSRLRQLLQTYNSAAEAFGPAWEATAAEVSLSDRKQGEVYRQLIDWAKGDDLFTTRRGGFGATEPAVLHQAWW
jgi:hypothetical protein